MIQISVSGRQFVDVHGRQVLLRGVNLSGDAKLPKQPDVPSHTLEHFWETDNVSFVGRPFDLQHADEHLARISSWGYNVVRFVLTWEAIEHKRPGIYDEDYIKYVISCLRKCGEHGLYVIMDPHQDVWSRYSGGSGAPYWTFIAAGMDPKRFSVTEAALVHNTFPNPTEFPKMIWSTNYDRLAVATMFILFFAGKHFAPKAIINGQNIQDFLQSHFMRAMAHVARRIHEAGDIEGNIVIGWETMNEPSQSWIGNPDLSVIPPGQHLRKGNCPSPSQAIALGSGIAQEVETWDFGSMGPKKIGTTLVDPKRNSIWLDSSFDDTRYGWSRNDEWKLGSCLWAQHGIWDVTTGVLTRPDYFLRDAAGNPLDTASFLEQFWMPHLREYKMQIRAQHVNAIIFCQPPVLVIPPIFTDEDKKDSQVVYSPHFYDGLTLMNKSWNTWYSVDILGILRGRYRSPLFAIKIGTKAIRNCLRDQLLAIQEEGRQNLGNYPCFLSEIGIPFDMDNGKAYETDNYTSQISALDANQYALEGSLNNYTLWHYSALNTNARGDFWNGEDLSFFSNSGRSAGTSLTSSISNRSAASAIPSESWFPPRRDLDCGVRAGDALCRPSPIRICGDLISYSFALSEGKFEMNVACTLEPDSKSKPTEIFLPQRHFSSPDIRVSHGRTEYHEDGQLLLWWHSSDAPEVLSKLVVVGRPCSSQSQGSKLCSIL